LLLALVAAAYWPARQAVRPATTKTIGTEGDPA